MSDPQSALGEDQIIRATIRPTEDGMWEAVIHRQKKPRALTGDNSTDPEVFATRAAAEAYIWSVVSAFGEVSLMQPEPTEYSITYSMKDLVLG